MKYLALASLSLALAFFLVFLLVTALTDANAVVCAHGVYRADCAGPRGALTAHHRTVRGSHLHGAQGQGGHQTASTRPVRILLALPST